MLAGHRQTQANNETGPSQGDPNNSSFTPRPRVSTERLSQNCTDTGPSIKMSAARLNLFDVGLKMVVYAGTGGDGPGAVSANI